MNKQGGRQTSGNHLCGTKERKKRPKRNEDSLRELGDNAKCTNILIIGVPQKKRERARNNS